MDQNGAGNERRTDYLSKDHGILNCYIPLMHTGSVLDHRRYRDHVHCRYQLLPQVRNVKMKFEMSATTNPCQKQYV